MGHSPRFPILLKLGLSEGEAEIFELLVEDGVQKARDLVKKSTHGRGNVYNILNSLIVKGLVLEISGTQKQYQAVDPSRLKTLLDKKKEETKRLESEFSESLASLSSLFKLSTGRPTIQVFEGLDGFEQALNDSLSAKTEILTYFDPAAVSGELAEINKRYVAKRRAKETQKRIILPDNQAARDYLGSMAGGFTQIILAKDFADGFLTAMETYDNKVNFLTLDKEKIISVIIEDGNIANLQRAQFEYIWKMEKNRQAASRTSSNATSDSSAM